MAKDEEYIFETTIEPPERFTFTLRFVRDDGTDGDEDTPEVEDHTFTVQYRKDDASTPLALAPFFVKDAKGNEGLGGQGVVELIKRLLVKGDYERFKALWDRDDLAISSKQMEDVGELISRKMTGRPTQALRSSAGAQRSNGHRSTAKRSSRAAI